MATVVEGHSRFNRPPTPRDGERGGWGQGEALLQIPDSGLVQAAGWKNCLMEVGGLRGTGFEAEDVGLDPDFALKY